MRAECDYIAWPATYDYRATLVHSTLVYIRGAGHSIASAQPELYLGVLRAFLLGRPLPAYTSVQQL